MIFEHYILLLAVGVFSGYINVVAGGGSILTVPSLIYVGLEATVANGTNRIAIFIQSITAVGTLWKEVRDNLNFYIKLSLITIPGSVGGAIAATKVSNDLLEIIIGIVMIMIIATILYPVKKLKQVEPNPKITLNVALVLLIAGVYGGFLQIGVGFILMAIFHRLMNYDLVRVNIMKVFVVTFFTLPAIIVFLMQGKIVYLPGIILAIGNAIGAWASAKISMKKGEKFIKFFLIVAILMISMQLLGIF